MTPTFQLLTYVVCITFVSGMGTESPLISPIPASNLSFTVPFSASNAGVQESSMISPVPVPSVPAITSSSVPKPTVAMNTSIPDPAKTPVIGTPTSTPATSQCGQRDWDAAKAPLRSTILGHSERSRWPARLLRAGFHDCFEGSCDGSLAHELNRPENNNIGMTIALLRRSIRGTCVTLADALKIGLELSMDLMGAPKLTCPKATVDAVRAGPVGEIPTSFQDAATILANFRRKGFTVEEALAGNFGGHSVGGFGGRLFTPTVASYGNDFAKFITRSISNATGFDALPSDRTLVNADTSKHVQSFADDKTALNKAFASFMQKLCSM